LLHGIEQFLGCAAPAGARHIQRAARRAGRDPSPAAAALAAAVPPRPVGFCTGCPERPIFTAMKLVQRELGPLHVSCDIGCHLFSILPPFNIGNTTMGYGLGAAGAAAFRSDSGKRPLAVMGDGGFWHNGLTSGVGNAVFNRSDQVLVVVDNGYAAATGGQDVPSSRTPSATRSTRHSIETAVRGVGVDWVRVVDRTYDLATMRDTLREALRSPAAGPKVVVAASECMLSRQRREAPRRKRAIAAGERVVQDRFGIDPEVCTGDHSCIRLSGCPSLTIRPRADRSGRPPVAYVDRSCVGCGLCGEIADVAALCPSFYRTRVVANPGRWDRFRARVRGAIIDWLQRRTEGRRLRHAF
ncbi:MAG TPA: thiamine pyrophosphate-dependent enzyme, partial [Steroidobacteraceae bacterium]|nr:thiamine pyrophosphate-dependent enzyme [Steroidobacteraceae bacterium]